MAHHPHILILLVTSSLCSAQTPAAQAPGNLPKVSTPTGEVEETRTATQSTQTSAAGRKTIGRTSDFAASVQNWRAERAHARENGAQNKEAEAALNEARALELWSSVDRAQVDRVPEAVAAYQIAMSSGSAPQRSLAANNLGVLLLRQGKPADALQTFRQVDLKAIAPADSYLYQYNYGRALELNHDNQGAYSHYSEAARLHPDFVPAVEGAYRTLWEIKPPPIRAAANLAEVVTEGGRAGFARDQLKHSLIQWSNEPEASQLLSALLRSYVALSISPPSFQKEEWPWLQKLGSPSLELGINELRLAYSGRFPYVFGYYDSRFPYWSRGNDREAFGDLLKVVGDYYAGGGSYSEALACYSNSWVIARLPEAALYAAALLRDHRNLDPEGRLVNQLVESLFEQKGNAYMKQDWPNILRLHTVLGTIFEGQSRWGSPSEPHSAIFQWQHALTAESQVIQRDPNFPPSPGLHLHLATCYRNVNRISEAQSEYLSAAEAFLKVSEPAQAASAMQALHSLGGTGTMRQDEANRVRNVEDILAHIGKG